MSVRPRGSRTRAVGLAALAAGVFVAGAARAAAPPAAAGDDLSVYVVTFGPGDHPFFKFGHDAIWIHDRAAHTDRVYNFGTFSFDSPRLILDFLHGRMTYWLSVSPLGPTLDSYRRENRTIEVQELALAADAKQALRARLDDNARVENRAYKYDYFLDNCATRVRDAVDRSIGGRLRAAARAPARLTLRGQALRMTADYLPLYVALDLILGPAVDRPIDRWAEMYIPEELARGLVAATVAGPAGDTPLVTYARQIFAARRAPPPEAPPERAGAFFACGLALALGFVVLAWAAARPSPAAVAARAALGSLLAAWGLVVGVIGCFLLYVWLGTDHVVAHRNQNLLLCAPWALALAALGVAVALGRRGAVRPAFKLAAVALAATLLACVVKLGVLPHQENGMLIAFFFPAWLGVTAATFILSVEDRRRAPPAGDL